VTLSDSNPRKRHAADCVCNVCDPDPFPSSDGWLDLLPESNAYRTWAWVFLSTTVLVAFALVVEVLRCR